MKNIYKLIALGTVITVANCQSKKEFNATQNAQITNTYTMQTCDKESKALFIEMKQNGESYTGFISTDNQHKIPKMQKKFKVGKHVSGETLKTHLDGIYLTRE